MYVLVANLGSTSFKYRLFDMRDERQLARGGIDRIGEDASACVVEIGDHKETRTEHIPDHAAAVKICLDQLTDRQHGCLEKVTDVRAIGFKAVFAGALSGVRRVDEELLAEMERLADVAPAHNPPYVRAMRQLQSAFPKMPLVAALETGFHETIPEEYRTYAVPYEWKQEYAIQRWGFHGASHRYVGRRVMELMGRDDLRIITCHLGGSNSLCAQEDGKSVATTMGMTPQTGLPQNNRVGDFDPYALPLIARTSGRSVEEILSVMASEGGLLGISGLSSDCRDLEEAAEEGNERAELALRVFEGSIRQYIGAYLAVLGGAEAIVFTGGIGENSRRTRWEACRTLEYAGVVLDEALNEAESGERKISSKQSRVQVWVIPTNEELVVARQTVELIGGVT